MLHSIKSDRSNLYLSPIHLLWQATERRPNLWIMGYVLPIFIGLLASAVGIMVGPLMQIVQAPLDHIHQWETIAGPFWGKNFTQILGYEGISGYDLLYRTPLVLMIFVTFKSLLTGAHWYLWEYMGELASKNIRLLLAQSHICLHPEFRLNKEGQEAEAQLSSAMTQDIRQMREYMVHYYGGFARELFQVLTLLISLTLLSWRLTFLFLGIVFPLGFVVRYIGKRIRRRAQEVLKYQSELTEWLEQRLMGIETIKHYRTENLETHKFQKFNEHLSTKFARSIATKVRTSPTIEVFASIAFVLVLVYSLESIQKNALSGSVFFSFFSTLALLSQSASKLGRYYNSNKEGTEAVNRIKRILRTFLDHQDEIHGAPRDQMGMITAPSDLKEITLRCHKLTFYYPGTSEPALSDVSLEFFPGKIYCLKGASGSGKSTLFKALLGIVRPKVRDGFPMIFWGERLKNHSYPISYMPQRFVPLNTTLIDHVVYPHATKTADLNYVRECLLKVGLDDLLKSIDDDLYTVIGSEGRQLSGGQLQRVLLARLWYHHSPLILVDEGTSALDPEVERLVHAFLRDLARKGSTIILIAHRISQIAFADIVLSMENGKVVECRENVSSASE